ncbi:ATP synthase mitochondrial F1 complex assembly factor 1-like [Amphiura filiformis]|uniref:ATP synthase mitochondrial F1 complex assembly factor 1-like n=1 Tax=Amphiura filiformis TaxID=82378 RepID=UPI003B213F82
MAAPMVRQILANAARNNAITTTSRGFVGSSCYKQNKEPEEKDVLSENPFFDKYADKIKELQRSKPEEFQSNLKAVKEKEKWNDAEKQPEEAGAKPKPAPMPRLLKAESQGASQHSLDSIIKMDLIQDLSADEISNLWKEFHAKKDCLSAIIPSPTYEHLHKKAQLYPLFLYPLPRAQGYEFVFAQFHGHQCFFTSLINYQAYQENAPIALTLRHYTELQKDKGIVLMRGELDTSAMGIQDAAILANQLQLYYATDNPERTRLLQTFNNEPNSFKHVDVIKQFENLQMELPTSSPKSAEQS